MKHREKGRLPSTPLVLLTHTHTDTHTELILYINLNPFGAQGRLIQPPPPPIITAQRDAFVRLGSQTSIRRYLHTHSKCTHTHTPCERSGRLRVTPQQPPEPPLLALKATSLFDGGRLMGASHICTQGLGAATSLGARRQHKAAQRRQRRAENKGKSRPSLPPDFLFTA